MIKNLIIFTLAFILFTMTDLTIEDVIHLSSSINSVIDRVIDNIMKNFMIVALALTLGACTTTNNPIYTVKTESGEYVTQVPGWFMADYTNMKLCGDETHEGMCIFGAGTSVSPDLNLAIEKAKMVAKSEIADMIKGTMNKQSKQFITEVGKTQSKTVVTEVESAIVNSIENTPVRGCMKSLNKM